MSDEFEKLDDWMMDASEAVRKKRVPEKELQGFQESVMRKIAQRQARGKGIPYGVMAGAAVIALAVFLGAVIYLHTIPVKKEQPVIQPQTKTVVVADFKPAPPSENIQTAQPVLMTVPSKAEEIVDEIEALKEIGVWTDQDEAEAGIPVEVTYAELEVAMDNNNQASVAAAPAVQS